MNHNTGVSIILAMTEKGVIGNTKNINGLPWSICDLKRDMERFRETTMGHLIVMGRKTAETLPGPLKGRRNVVLTRDADLLFKEGFGIMSMSAILRRSKHQKIFCIGGRNVYDVFYPHANEMLQTVVHADLNGNVSFKVFNSKRDGWKLENEEHFNPSEKNKYPLTFYRYTR